MRQKLDKRQRKLQEIRGSQNAARGPKVARGRVLSGPQAVRELLPEKINCQIFCITILPSPGEEIQVEVWKKLYLHPRGREVSNGDEFLRKEH